MAQTEYPTEMLLEIKKYLDNGYTQKQTQHVLDVSMNAVRNVACGFLYDLPTFDRDPVLFEKLRQLNYKQMVGKISKKPDKTYK